MKKIFVIYNKNTGFIDGGSGRVDQDWDKANADGSTMSERIVAILLKDADRGVIYLPNGDVPDREKFMVKSGKLKKMDADDLDFYKTLSPKTLTQLLEERIIALEDKLLTLQVK